MNVFIYLFLILTIGYLVGRIKIFGLSLGTSAILTVALCFGHFGVTIPSEVKNIGLICFVTSIGFIAGPTFFRNFKKNAISYIIVGISIVLMGALLCALIVAFTDIPVSLAIGLFVGAATSTPGLAAAVEVTGDALSSIGYGIAYPFGVIGIVLFVQIIPELLKLEKYVPKDNEEESKQVIKNLFIVDRFGFFPFSVAVVLGLLLAKLNIPLPGGMSFNLGTAGGPLISGLILGHFGKIKNISIRVNKNTTSIIRELGLALFLSGAGTEAGKGFIETISNYGIILVPIGILFTIIPTFVGFLLATKVFRLETYDALGCVCGGQTSTPALGALIEVSGSDEIASSYAASYPAALMCVVLSVQILAMIFR